MMAPSGATDLFGKDPVADPLAYYSVPDPRADLFLAAEPAVAQAWRSYAAGLAGGALASLSSAQGFIDRQVEELGLAVRLTGDEHERAWPLNPMPLILGAGEWAAIEAGLIQRARLLEAVIADIYGPQRLVRQGHLPAAVVSGSGHFARRMVGLPPPGGHYLHVYAADLARGPTGEWRVLSDRARLPVGIGYALENRLAIGRATGDLLARIGVRAQGDFFDTLRAGIAANCARADPRIALLTPGRFNQSYPEQAHLARQLGLSLVEGRDLVVRDGRLYVRTIAGLKRIDALWRWIGTREIDPLNFDARSRIGVPGLVNACANGLVMANWPGVGVVESRAMPAFLPRLARVLLGETLALPNAATWWLGGAAERAHVLANIDQLVVSSAFRQPVPGLPEGVTRAGSELDAAARAELLDGVARRPMDYTAQEIVRLSTTPTLAEGRFEARSFTLRVFLARDETGAFVALPGGFARVSDSGALHTSLMGLGDISTDVCVIDAGMQGDVAGGEAAQVEGARVEAASPAIRREQGLLPSQAADNLYWIGRYGERCHQTLRIVRELIEQVSQTVSGAPHAADAQTAVTRLADLLRGLGAVPPHSVRWQPARLAGTALGDIERPGSVRALATRTRAIALLLRDRLTRDSWRGLQRSLPHYIPGDLDSMSAACDRLIERSAALARLTSEGMSRGPAWRFLDLGTCIERASVILQTVEGMVVGKPRARELAALLDLADAQMIYRSRYQAAPQLVPTLDVVLLDPAQPRGLALQTQRIVEHLASLPTLREDGLPEAPLRLARLLEARVVGLPAAAVDGAVLASLRADLRVLSDAIAQRYFLQEEGPAERPRMGILG